MSRFDAEKRPHAVMGQARSLRLLRVGIAKFPRMKILRGGCREIGFRTLIAGHSIVNRLLFIALVGMFFHGRLPEDWFSETVHP